MRTQSDKIRDQENAVLDIFSQESFFKVRLNTAPLLFVDNLIYWDTQQVKEYNLRKKSSIMIYI